MYHVYSTLAASTFYANYVKSPQNNVNISNGGVLIKGGSGVARKGIGTAFGIHNSVSDEDMEWLKDDPSFKQHVGKGYITVRKSEVSSEVAAADMVTFDRSTDACPIVPQEFSDKAAGDGLTAIEPKTNKKSK